MKLRALALVSAVVLLPPPVAAQLEVGGYGLGVGSYAAESDLLPAGATWFGRGRLMLDYGADWLTFEAAYEHVLQRQPEGGGFGITNPGGQRVSTDWLPLDWTIHESERSSWRHRFDRLAVQASRGPVVVTVGRQTISWATTLFLTPADPFAPFDPTDPFREYRGGVDAVRVQGFAGPFTELEAVVRGSDTPDGATTTALGRVATSRGTWAFGGWLGILHDEAAGAVFVTGGLGATSLRSELSVREDPTGGALLRSSLGFDRYFQVKGKDLYGLVELQYDGFGAVSPDELLAVAGSDAFQRGDMQVLGRWTAAAQATYQVHPLVGVDALAMVNVGDPSLLVAPGITWSTTSAVSTRLGMFFGVGEGATTTGFVPVLGSEYGSVPPLVYAAMSMYF